MLQASKLSCSCQEATVSFPPALGDEVVVPVLGAQATSMTVPAVATTSRCNQRGRAPVIRALVGLMVGAFYGRPPKRVNESPAFLRFVNMADSLHPPVGCVPERGIGRGIGHQIVQMWAGEDDQHPFEER